MSWDREGCQGVFFLLFFLELDKSFENFHSQWKQEPEPFKAHTSMSSKIAKMLEETELSGGTSLSVSIDCGESFWGSNAVADVCPSTAANGSFPVGCS